MTKQICEIGSSNWFYYKQITRWTFRTIRMTQVKWKFGFSVEYQKLS